MHENKQNKLTAKQFKANLIKEQAEATEELIATLTENHTRQMETLIKSMTDAMKEMMQLIKSNATNPTNPSKLTDNEKKKKCNEKRKLYNKTPVCTHCGKKHPTKKEDECWELEKNKSSRPANWKSSKSTCRCMGSSVEAETWQPGKVVSNKLNTIITYPAAMNYWTPLYEHKDKLMTMEEEINMTRITHTPKPTTNKWTRRISRRQERKNQKEEESIIIDSGATLHFVTEELNLPRTRPSELTVYLPDDLTLRATGTTQLPFEQLSTKARKANILPGLTKSLISVNKMAESGYTTIF